MDSKSLFRIRNKNRHKYEENLRYKSKTSKLQRLIKEMVFENAALCDHVSHLQEQLIVVQEDRKFLLKKLLTLEQTAAEETEESKAKKPLAVPPVPCVKPASVKPVHVRQQVMVPVQIQINVKPNVPSPAPAKKPTGEVTVVKARRNTHRKKRYVLPIPVDVSGRPLFPIQMGSLTVYSLGDAVLDRPGFHTENEIYPVGFRSSRTYASVKEPREKTMYHFKILDGGTGPIFEVICSTTGLKMNLTSGNECHTAIISLINKTIGLNILKLEARGGEFFGYTVPTIQNLIQSITNIRKCVGYKAQKFEVTKAGEPPQVDCDPSIHFEHLQNSIVCIKNHLQQKLGDIGSNKSV